MTENKQKVLEQEYIQLYSDEIPEKPVCCKACGGPFPECYASCTMSIDW